MTERGDDTMTTTSALYAAYKAALHTHATAITALRLAQDGGDALSIHAASLAYDATGYACDTAYAAYAKETTP